MLQNKVWFSKINILFRENKHRPMKFKSLERRKHNSMSHIYHKLYGFLYFQWSQKYIFQKYGSASWYLPIRKFTMKKICQYENLPSEPSNPTRSRYFFRALTKIVFLIEKEKEEKKAKRYPLLERRKRSDLGSLVERTMLVLQRVLNLQLRR